MQDCERCGNKGYLGDETEEAECPDCEGMGYLLDEDDEIEFQDFFAEEV